MNRRQFAKLLPAAASVAVTGGCDSEPRPAATATLTNNDAIKNQMVELDSIVADLEQDAENFDGTSWREVVPQVKEHIEQLRGALDDLEQALRMER